MTQRVCLLPQIIEQKNNIISEHNKILEKLTNRFSVLQLEEIERKKRFGKEEDEFRARLVTQINTVENNLLDRN